MAQYSETVRMNEFTSHNSPNYSMLVTRTDVNVSSLSGIPMQTERGDEGTAPSYVQPQRQKGVGSGKCT
jgi:hypothetical protein